ncbi:flagellar hook-associated protein 2 [Psychrobacillus sp. MER TA 171]|uniref:flagellar hook-associated protein 2 n=1 Tax=Psychrobacillus sp. MER TA 171 TaxID=2939577 RepID=UPI002040EC88|nr:flagellar hook-associated protein 2 [Psychrobacillus sp. MER TA 171]MCM3356760.1 flagellar hook-associated protein 2 [Psychrobacillus sp. MER TA 171]
MRITGLASGMDTESIIKDLMKAQRIPLDKIMQKKQYMEWQRDDYRSANKKLFDFRTLTSDTMIRQSTYIQKTVTSSAPDDISVKNVNSTSDFTGKINVKQLAEAATMQSTERVLASDADLTKKLKDLNVTVPTSFTIKTIKADGTLDKDGYIVKLDENSTMQSVLDDINKNSGVNAFYDSFTGKMAFTAKNSGELAKTIAADGTITNNNPSEIIIEGDTNNFLKLEDAVATDGKNAIFIYNGLETQRQSNTFQINGFEVSLKKASNTDITFSSAPDTDKILASVTKFVDEYNKLIENLNSEIREKKYRDFHPLSTEQKADMKEKEIELWEEKAKSGTLRNDSVLSNALGQLRSALNSAVSGVAGADRLSEIGISTSSNYMENGKLVIDETKLRKAISDDPNQVYELFAADGATDSEKGLARRLVATLDETRKKVIEKAGTDSAVNTTFSLGRTLKGYDDQISRFELRLQNIETRYFKQFSAMESVILRANNQSSYLMNAFGGGQ